MSEEKQWVNEWTVLTVRQPWAWLIVNGFKRVENRTWRTDFRGPLMIHASGGMKRQDWRDMFRFCRRLEIDLPGPDEFTLGAVVGAAVVTGCVKKRALYLSEERPAITCEADPWFEGPWGFVLEDAIAFEPLRVKGQLGLWKIPAWGTGAMISAPVTGKAVEARNGWWVVRDTGRPVCRAVEA